MTARGWRESVNVAAVSVDTTNQRGVVWISVST